LSWLPSTIFHHHTITIPDQLISYEDTIIHYLLITTSSPSQINSTAMETPSSTHYHFIITISDKLFSQYQDNDNTILQKSSNLLPCFIITLTPFITTAPITTTAPIITQIIFSPNVTHHNLKSRVLDLGGS